MVTVQLSLTDRRPRPRRHFASGGGRSEPAAEGPGGPRRDAVPESNRRPQHGTSSGISAKRWVSSQTCATPSCHGAAKSSPTRSCRLAPWPGCACAETSTSCGWKWRTTTHTTPSRRQPTRTPWTGGASPSWWGERARRGRCRRPAARRAVLEPGGDEQRGTPRPPRRASHRPRRRQRRLALDDLKERLSAGEVGRHADEETTQRGAGQDDEEEARTEPEPLQQTDRSLAGGPGREQHREQRAAGDERPGQDGEDEHAGDVETLQPRITVLGRDVHHHVGSPCNGPVAPRAPWWA